jgi:hypothetical protein
VNRELAHKIADAVLYEGYMLYPYRPSALKNRQRWTFGILYPPAYSEVRTGTERSQMHSECLIEADDASIGIELRFLQLISGQAKPPAGRPLDSDPSPSAARESAENADEAFERSVEIEIPLRSKQEPTEFHFSDRSHNKEQPRESAAATHPSGATHELRGTISATTDLIRDGLWKLTIEIANTSSLSAETLDRNSVLRQSFLSTHAILTANGGQFVSLLDPSDHLHAAASSCVNVGNFPVLVGSPGEREMLLCSPILLYDYPQIAPESAGDFYDSTEMDEMLTLRVITLTDQEKNEMRQSEDRVRDLLQRTEQSAREQLMRTHGTIRSSRPVEDTK